MERSGFLVRLPEALLSFSGVTSERRDAPAGGGDALHETRILLVAGGRPPAAEWLRQVAAGREVWCADRGVDACRKAGVVPARLVGDEDSARHWEWAKSLGAKVDRVPREKDFTDTQLALRLIARERPHPSVVMAGAFGGRLDHTLSNVYSFFGSGLPGCLADGRETAAVVRGGEEVRIRFVRKPYALSLLPLTPLVTGVTLTGTRWPLDSKTLTAADPYAISNEAAGDLVTLAVREGALLVCACGEE